MLAHTGLSNEQFQHTEETFCGKPAENTYSRCCSILTHELCMTNLHALLQRFAVLAAWVGWQVAEQLLVKVLHSEMTSVEQRDNICGTKRYSIITKHPAVALSMLFRPAKHFWLIIH